MSNTESEPLERTDKSTENTDADESSDADLTPSTFGINGIDGREDAAEADLDERVDELWGRSQ